MSAKRERDGVVGVPVPDTDEHWTATHESGWTIEGNVGRYQVCPLCGGRGFVAQDFYNSLGYTTGSSSEAGEPCKSCDGRGIVR